MKLRGILSSKGRRVAFERNQAPAPEQSQPMAGHKPTPHADGSLACSGCGAMRYSPAAFAAHVNGDGPKDALGEIFTMGPCDPWLAQHSAERKHNIQDRLDAEWRAEMIEACYDERKRAPRIAEGVGKSITD